MKNIYKNNLNDLCCKIIPKVLFIFLQQGKNDKKMIIKRLVSLGSLPRPIVVFLGKDLLKKEKLQMLQYPQT